MEREFQISEEDSLWWVLGVDCYLHVREETTDAG